MIGDDDPDKYEVLLHKRTRELWHVTKRFKDRDHNDDEFAEFGYWYRLEDDTHTTREHWCYEDLEHCFVSTDVVNDGQKPIQTEELSGWYD